MILDVCVVCGELIPNGFVGHGCVRIVLSDCDLWNMGVSREEFESEVA